MRKRQRKGAEQMDRDLEQSHLDKHEERSVIV